MPPETWRLACPPVRPAWQSRFEVPEALADELSLSLPRGEVEEDGWAFDGTMCARWLPLDSEFWTPSSAVKGRDEFWNPRASPGRWFGLFEGCFAQSGF